MIPEPQSKASTRSRAAVDVAFPVLTGLAS